MSSDNPIRKKIGPLEVWQYIAIGTAAGFMYWLYKKKTGESKEVNPEEEEKLLGALSRAGGGGGEGGSFGGGAAQLPVPGLEGPKGETGPAGPEGQQGVQGEAPSADLEAKVNAIQSELANNNPPTLSHNGGPQGLPKGESRNSKGEVFRTEVKGNGIYHVYPNRKGPLKVLRVGTVHKPAKKTKRPKPTPVHKRAQAKHVTHKPKRREPVHR